MKIRVSVLLFLLSLKIITTAQSSIQFNSLDSLFKYAEKNSATIKTNNEQSLLAKWTKITALGNMVNLRSPISASLTDNTQLPINYVPSEMLGGKPGTVRELAFGQKYVTNYGFTPQIDIINLSAWARLKSASVNKDLTEVNNLIAKKNLFESIAASYFNIVSLQNQLVSLEKNQIASDSVLKIITNKYNLGIAREQDKNNAEINSLSVKDKLDELKASLGQQYNVMKILCDIQTNTEIKIDMVGNKETTLSAVLNTKSTLEAKQMELQTAYLRSELTANRLITFAPTLSFIFNQAWQQSSNTGFFDANAYHYSTQYYGIKLTVPFPLDVNRLALDYTAKIGYKISQISSEHTALQNNLNNKQLELDYAKAYSGYVSSKRISELKEINYEKSMNQYKEGILSTDLLLTTFTDMINAQLVYINAEATLHYTESKIKINNTYN